LNFSAASGEKRGNSTYFKLLGLAGQSLETPARNSWTTGLEANVIWGPEWVESHVRSGKEIMAQDANFNLYFLSPQGEVIWKKELDGPVLGKVYTVDRYRNKKLQYVLNTPGSLYAIDRRGRDLDGFPVTSEIANTAGCTVLDYDNNRNYRILLPRGSELLNFNIEGKEVKGWEFESMPGSINQPITYLSSDGKDYLIAADDRGTLRAVSRSGKKRWDPDLQIELSQDNLWWPAPQGNAKLDGITGLDVNRQIVYIFTSGTMDKGSTGAEWFRLFDGKGLMLQDGNIRAETPRGTVEIKGDFTLVKPLIFNGKYYLMALNAREESIYLFDEKGDEVDGFPVYGQGYFTAGDAQKNGKLQVISRGSGGSIVSYIFDRNAI
jgi:outer membrane protein assembly factor BamB